MLWSWVGGSKEHNEDQYGTGPVLWMMESKNGSSFKAPVYAALTLAFASLGDAFLYPYLPVNSAQVGVPVVWVGALLSVNRFARVIANVLMLRICALYGLRRVTIGAAAVALVSTAGYSVASGIFAWLLFRVFWGLAFSALRISTLGFALEQSRQGLALGISRSLQEAGPMLALAVAPLLVECFSPASIFLWLAMATLPAIYFAIKLPVKKDKAVPYKPKSNLQFPSAFNAIALVSAFVIDGLLVVVLGTLFLQYEKDITPLIATTLAAGYLAYRKICLVGLSIVGGWMADGIGFEKILTISVLFMIAGLFILAGGWVSAGAAIVFTWYSIYSAVVPGSAGHQQESRLTSAAENATWRDLGAATGALAAGSLLTTEYLPAILLIATFGLLALLFIQSGAIRKAKSLYAWK